jgi:polysaccharide export outer membrane protein
MNQKAQGRFRLTQLRLVLAVAGTGIFLGLSTGCETQQKTATASPTVTSTAAEIEAWQQAGKLSEMLTIREGDVLKISFPGAPNLDSTQQVRADGIITLDIAGEVRVTGLSPKELEAKLAKLYATQLVSNEVTVAVVSSSFDVFVSGAVLRPGKITTTKPITAFQAIMEAGYDPAIANLQNVTVIREDARSKYIYLTLNLQLVLEGKDTRPFYLKPSDTVQVPKKVTIF